MWVQCSTKLYFNILKTIGNSLFSSELLLCGYCCCRVNISFPLKPSVGCFVMITAVKIIG